MVPGGREQVTNRTFFSNGNLSLSFYEYLDQISNLPCFVQIGRVQEY